MSRESIRLGYAPLIEVAGTDDFSTQLWNIWNLRAAAVEYSPAILAQLFVQLSQMDIMTLRQFEYRSMHAPANGLRYSASLDQAIVQRIHKAAADIHAHTLVFHPDIVDDWQWLHETFGKDYTLAFENMDKQKPYGKTVDEMTDVLEAVPDARLVIDVNHCFGIDQSMVLADAFWQTFAGQIAHVHLSGHGGGHGCVSQTNEDEIIFNIKDLSLPIIHEGGAARNASLLKQEDEYVLERLVG